MMPTAAYRVHLCFGPNCARFEPKALLQALEDEVRVLGLEDEVSIQLSACRQRCEQSPSMNVYPGPICYNRLTPDAVRAIVRQHLTGGEPVAEYLFRPGMKPTLPLGGVGATPRRAASSQPQSSARKRRWWS